MKVYIYKNLYININRCFICNSPELEITQMPFKKLKDKLCGIHIGNKKEWTINMLNKMNESENDNAKWKELSQKEYILYYSIYMKL